MATSGTFNFTLDLADVMEEAYERVGGEMKTGYDYKTARRSLDLLMLEWQNKGLNLWTVKNASLPLVAGTGTYALTNEKLDIIEGLLRTDEGDPTKQSDFSMRRVSVSNWARQTNKLSEGRPTQYWIERTPDNINVHLWQVPDSTQSYVFNYYYLERIEDAGKPANNTMDVPARYLPVLVAGLAYYIGLKTPAAVQIIPALKQVYDEQWDLASDAAREKAGFFVKPAIPRVGRL
jgi:hypothetical protein